MSRVYALAAEVRKVDSPVAQYMRRMFPNVPDVSHEWRDRLHGLPTIRPRQGAEPAPYATIGAALDYRLRYYFRESIIETSQAFHGLQRVWAGTSEDGALMERVQVSAVSAEPATRMTITVSIPRVARDFFDSLRVLLPQLRPTRRVLKPGDELLLSRYCYILALFEETQRNWKWHETASPLKTLKRGATLDDLLALVDDEWVKDIGRMAWLFGKRHSRLFYSKVRVNPKFNFRAGGFGADPDLLIDGDIIDIKAVINPSLDPLWLYQVVGYALLDFGDHLHIAGVGLYLARQGVFVRWPLAELLPRVTGRSDVSLDELRTAFHDVLMREMKYR